MPCIYKHTSFLPCRLTACLKATMTYALCNQAFSPEKEKRKEFRNEFPVPSFKLMLRKNKEWGAEKTRKCYGNGSPSLWTEITALEKKRSSITEQPFFQPGSNFL